MAFIGPLEMYCFYLFSEGGRFHYEGFGFGSFMFANIAAQIVGYYLIALVAIPLGYGHVKRLRWARTLSLTNGASSRVRIQEGYGHVKRLRWARTLSLTLLGFWLVAGIPLFLHYLTCFYYYGLAGKTQFPSKYSFMHQLFRFFSTIYHDFLSFDLSFWNYVFFFEWEFPFFWTRIMVLLCMLIFLILFLKAVFSSKFFKDLLKPQIGVLFYFVLYMSTLFC